MAATEQTADTPELPQAFRPNIGERRLSFVAFTSAGLILLGMLVLAGWLLRIPLLVQVVPGMTSMVASTAIGFVLAGLTLGAHQATDPSRRALAVWPTLALLLLAMINLAQRLSGLELGINFAALHGWLDNPRLLPAAARGVDGQMSDPTTLCFLLASFSSLALCRRGPRMFTALLGRAAAALVTLIGLSAVIGYGLQLEALYSWYTLSHVALHTAIGMSLLGTALWWLWRSDAARVMDERWIVTVGTMALVVVAIVASLIGVAAFRIEGENVLGKGLELARQGRADVLTTTLDLRSQRAATLSTRATLIHLLKLKRSDAGYAAALAAANEDIASLQPHGFSSMVVKSHDGVTVLSSGTPHDEEAAGLPIKVSALGEATLIRHGGFVLRNQIEIVDQGLQLGSITVEQRLEGLHDLLLSGSDVHFSDETLVCGPATATNTPLCLRATRAAGQNDLLAPAATGLLPAITAALQGQRGASRVPVADGRTLLAAYGPASGSGLAVTVLLDTAELYAPVRSGLLIGFLITAAITLLAVLLLRAKLQPLARQLATAEGRYRTVVSSVREGLLLQDAQHRILASNPAASNILGISPNELLGRTTNNNRWGLLREDLSDWPAEALPAARTLRTGRPQTDLTMGLRKPDGQLRWLSVSTVMARGLAGTDESGVVISFEDITERRNAEALSRQLEQRFRLLVDNVGDYGIFMLGLDGTIVSWNKGAERITGYRSDEILGRHFSCFYTPEDRTRHWPAQALRVAADTGRATEEGWRVRKNGSRIWANVLTSAIHDDNGQHIGFAMVTHDLSERRRLEQEVSKANGLRNAIMASAPYAIMSVDTDGVITAVNPAFERMLWYRADELVGLCTGDVVHDAREIAGRAQALFSERGRSIEPGFAVLTDAASRGLTEEREWTYVRSDGSRLPVSLAISALRDTAGRITGYLGIAYDITERKRREEYTQHIAHHDFLTGLPNRMLLHDRLAMAMEQARRSGQKVAVLMLDLDHFKRVNDSLGHHIGDELLKAVAERVGQCVRAIDTVARMGGDEFVIVLGELPDVRDAETVAAHIVEAVSRPIQIGSHDLSVTPSIGISCFPSDGADGHALLKHADSAMYRAKAAGRRGYCTFNSEMARQSHQRLAMETAIRRALKEDEFKLHYQPQVCLGTGAVTGMEALLRWEDPVHGAVSPDQFISIAEESGLIEPLGQWVLETACREARELQRLTGHPLRLAVNLSARQFRQTDVVNLIRRALGNSGLSAACLELEITEGVLMMDTDESIARLNEIRRLGVTIAIDDFGVGFSSLSYITRFPIDTLKIDRSFISKLPHSSNDAAVTQAIIALGTSLGITVVAEGVETREQLDFLRARHCDLAQGFLLGRPVAAHTFSVQGFCFGKAVPAEVFAADFAALCERGQQSVDGVL